MAGNKETWQKTLRGHNKRETMTNKTKTRTARWKYNIHMYLFVLLFLFSIFSFLQIPFLIICPFYFFRFLFYSSGLKSHHWPAHCGQPLWNKTSDSSWTCWKWFWRGANTGGQCGWRNLDCQRLKGGGELFTRAQRVVQEHAPTPANPPTNKNNTLR